MTDCPAAVPDGKSSISTSRCILEGNMHGSETQDDDTPERMVSTHAQYSLPKPSSEPVCRTWEHIP